MKWAVLYFFGFLTFLENYNYCCCLRMKMIPGIPVVRYYDKNYLEDIVINTRRNGRKSEYVVNVEFTNKYYSSNNVSLHFYFKQYLHNEYRPSFVEIHVKLCDLILKDMFMGVIMRSAGMTACPIPPGKYSLRNLTFNQEFPSVWPFEHGQCELIGKAEPSGKEIGRGDITLTFKMFKD